MAALITTVSGSAFSLYPGGNVGRLAQGELLHGLPPPISPTTTRPGVNADAHL